MELLWGSHYSHTLLDFGQEESLMSRLWYEALDTSRRCGCTCHSSTKFSSVAWFQAVHRTFKLVLKLCRTTKLPVSTGWTIYNASAATTVLHIETATATLMTLFQIFNMLDEVSGTHWQASSLASLNSSDTYRSLNPLGTWKSAWSRVKWTRHEHFSFVSFDFIC